MADYIIHINLFIMTHVLGLLDDKICILIEGARIILTIDLDNSDYQDLVDYTNLPKFKTWEEVETAAFGE